MFPRLPSIDALEALREEDGLMLYRGAVGSAGRPELISMTSRDMSIDAVRRLEREYSQRGFLDERWSARPTAFIEDGTVSALWLTDPGGDVLSRRIGRPWELGAFLRVAIGIAAALDQTHEAGLIHCDLKPDNILVDTDSGRAWLTGFTFASRVPRQPQSIRRSDIIAGTLAYMAPEQTGRMNRSIDLRSDLYALGVVFHQMLAGELPFRASDPLEWIHCHIARQPASLSERQPAVPVALAGIVAKLLAKTGEERYQTAAGLRADLEHCLSQLAAYGRISEFRLGTCDSSGRLVIPERLYGREREIEALLAAFGRVMTHGQCEVTLVSGHSGIGKSSIVNELHKVIVLPRGIFIAGKFDQRLRDTPYSSIAEAFRGLIRQLVAGDPANIDGWRKLVSDAVGRLGGALLELIPELAILIGPQPPLPMVSARESSMRFQSVFLRLIGAFARKEHPLVLFLDDLQWLDPATLSLVRHIAVHPDAGYLNLVGAYRDNEVGPDHPLLATIDAIGASGRSITQLELGPLGVEDMTSLVCDALRTDSTQSRRLAELVCGKTGGNPFFAGQFLSNLAEEGLLRFDAQARQWTWDEASIGAKDYTDNLVELMVRRLWRLPARTQEALRILSCFGNQADFGALGLFGGSESVIHSHLRAAVEAGIVLPEEGRYRFLHDRVQESVYALISASSREAVHLRIAKSMLEGLQPEAIADRIFDIANQFNAGQTQLVDADDRRRAAEINLQAGRKARASAAYTAACSYVVAGAMVLGAGRWDEDYELAFELCLEQAECEISRPRLDEAGALIDELFLRARSRIHRSKAYILRMMLQMMRGKVDLVVRSALEGLELFGQRFPQRPTAADVQSEYGIVRRALGDRPIESLAELPFMDDPDTAAVMSIMMQLGMSSYFTDANLYQMIACRLAQLTIAHGLSESSTYACAGLSICLGPVFHRFADGERFARAAVAIAEKGGYLAFRAGAYITLQQAVLWTKPISVGLSCIETSYKLAQESGALIFACYGVEHRLTDLMFRGDSLDVLCSEAVGGLAIAEKSKVKHVVDVILSMRGFIQALRGRREGEPLLDDEELEARALSSGIPIVACFHWILQVQRCILFGDATKALAYVRKAAPIAWSAQCHIQSVHLCMFESLGLVAASTQAAPEERRRMREEIDANLTTLRRWGESCPSNFAHRLGLVLAEVARLDGREVEALRLYEQAIESASDNGFTQDCALACELSAAFYSSLGLHAAARERLRDARESYRRWGAHAKVAQLDEEFPYAEPPRASTMAIEAPLEHVDLAAIVKISQTLSGEIVHARLIERLMKIALEHAAAERGLLVVQRGEESRLEAFATSHAQGVSVQPVDRRVTSADMPQAILHHVIRNHRGVVLDDARQPNAFSRDDYIRQRAPRSILCLPLLKQGELIGVIYLENNLASRVFTPTHSTVLELLSSQAAISLQNADLYARLERENAERKQSDERYALAIEAAADGHAHWIADEDTFYASPRLLEQWGLPPELSIAKRQQMLDLFPFHPDDRARVVALLEEQRIRDDVKRLEFDTRVICRGEVRWMHVTILHVRDGSGRLLRMAIATTDITARTRAEEEMRASEERYALALAGSDESIFDWDLKTQRIYIAQRTQELLGIPPGEVWRSREEWQQFVRYHHEDVGRQRAAMDAHIAGLTMMYDIELRILLPTGERWLHQRGRALRDAEGVAYRVVGSIGDITDRKREQEELRRLEGRLRQAEHFEAMGTLAGGIAHDFNNILGAILGFGERGLRKAEQGSRLWRDLNNVITAGERGRTLVDRILTFSRGTAGKRVPVHVEQVVREALALLRAKLPPRIRLQSQLHAGRAAIMGDSTQIHQVLMNLGTNAVHAMEGEGQLTVGLDIVELAEARPATAGAVVPGSWLALRVADEGMGIPADIADRIFDPFFTTKEVGVGTGLGLSLVLRIVTQVGGAIDVHSEPGVGSVFTVYLPRAGDAPEEQDDAMTVELRGNGQRIMIVDDEELLLELVTDELRSLGYEPVGFVSAQSALDAFRANPESFDALITDQRMPRMTGDALIRGIRQLSPLIPIILVSGYTGDAGIGLADNGWADEVLTKPLRANALAMSLARLLDIPM